MEQPKQINTSSFGNTNLNSSEKKVEDKEVCIITVQYYYNNWIQSGEQSLGQRK